MKDDEIVKKLRELNTRLYDMKTQALADRHRMATRNDLIELNDNVTNRLFYFGLGGVVILLGSLFVALY